MPPPLPWTSLADVRADHDYVLLATALPLTRLSATPRFLRLVWQVRNQLTRSPGLVGYSLYARPLARRYWTLSAWTDTGALREFVAAAPHSQVMTRLHEAMGTTRFAQWSCPGAQLPPAWPDALARLNDVTPDPSTGKP